MRGALACTLLLACTALHAKCPDTAEFKSWLHDLDSTDPLIQLPTAFSLPPLTDSEVIDAECIGELLPAPVPESRMYLIAQLAESRVALSPFLQRASRGLSDPNEAVRSLSALALARRGTDAVPTLLARLVEPPTQDELQLATKARDCNEARYRPWGLAGSALVRIGTPVIPQVLKFAKTPRSYPLKPRPASSMDCGSSLAHVVAVVAKVDPAALIDLYEAVGGHFQEADRRIFLGWLASKQPARVGKLLSRFPELLSRASEFPFELLRLDVAGLPASAAPSLLREASDAKSPARNWAFQSLWLIDAGGRSTAVEDVLLSRLASAEEREFELPVELLLKHGVQGIAGTSARQQLRRLMNEPPLSRRLAVWKGLHELEHIEFKELQPILLSGIDQLSTDAKQAPNFFAALSYVASPKDAETLSRGLTEPQSRRLTLTLDAASCAIGDRSAFAAQLAEGRGELIDDSTSAALANQLAACRKREAEDKGEDVDISRDGTFWGSIQPALGDREFVALALRVAEKESATGRDSLFPYLLSALSSDSSPVEDEPDPGAVKRAIAMPDFVAFLKRELVTADERSDSHEAAEFLATHGLVNAEDVQGLKSLVERTEGRSDQSRYLYALTALGNPGWNTLTELSRTAPLETRRTMIDFLPGNRADDQWLSMLEVLAADRDDEIRIEALSKIAEASTSDALTRALTRRPADVRPVLSNTLDWYVSPKAEENLTSALNARADLRRSAGAVLTRAAPNAEGWTPYNWRIAAAFGGASRQQVARYLDHPCYGLRQVALGSLIRSAQTADEKRQLLQTMLDGAPFGSVPNGSSSACPQPTNEPGERDFSTGSNLPFLSVTELQAGITASGMSTQAVARQFLRHANAAPAQAASDAMRSLTRWAIESLGTKSSNSEDQSLIDDALRRVLVSGCEECVQSIEPIVVRGGYDDRLLMAYGLRQLRWTAMADLTLDASGLEEIIVTGSQIKPLPRLEIAPPSDRMELPERLTQHWTTFGAAWAALKSALETARYPRYGLFQVDGGIAVVTALERVNDDGSPAAEKQRWQLNEQAEVSSLTEYIALLFLGESGRYRLITFVLAPNVPTPQSQSALSADTAQAIYLRGSLDLPPDLANRSFAGNGCYVLVYEYQRAPGKVEQIIPGVTPSIQHLQWTGILTALGQQ